MKGDFIETYSGIAFYPLDPIPEDIRIHDIAHALSNICRFTGHVKRFYSVAEHSVHVSRICQPQDALWGLLHDAAEAYICDLSRPLKKHSELGAQYKAIESAIMATVARKFGLPEAQPASVDLADKTMLAIEARDLMNPNRWWDKWADLIGFCEIHVNEPLLPGSAEQLFLARFRALTPDSCGMGEAYERSW